MGNEQSGLPDQLAREADALARIPQQGRADSLNLGVATAVMPNLENLRKKAKQFKRWHQDRYYPVAAEIRHWLSRYRHLNDRQILELEFKLADAQELVAAQEGFESWAALKQGLTEMSATDQQKSACQPTLLDAQPQLFVDDIQAACDFYSQKLGFTIAFTYGEPPFYAQVVRDAARLNLRHVDMS